jgi:hypothetical protein
MSDRLRDVIRGTYQPLRRFGLARTAAKASDVEKSRTAYQDFFALWKDADPDIPILVAARQEYSRLKRLRIARALAKTTAPALAESWRVVAFDSFTEPA